MRNDQPKLSKPYAIFSLSIMLFFGGVLIGQGDAPQGIALFLAPVGAIWLLGIGIYNIGKEVGRSD